MKKFQFSAIDAEGRICHGVMKAAGEEEARGVLFDNGLHPKRLMEAGGDEAVTWGPRPTRREDNPGSHFFKGKPAESVPVRAIFPTKGLIGQEAGQAGQGGLSDSGGFVFKSPDEDCGVVLTREEIEVATISGFFPRVLRITRIDGRMHEFTVGTLFAHANARETARVLNGGK